MKLDGALAEDDVHVRPLLHQLAGQVCGLVAGYASRDPKDNVAVSAADCSYYPSVPAALALVFISYTMRRPISVSSWFTASKIEVSD